MTVTIKKSKACGTIAAPPSKSAAHRALICGALSNGSEICNIEYSNDILATLDCLEALQAKIVKKENAIWLGGLDPFNASGKTTLNCRESGSTLRFMIPLAMLSKNPTTFVGTERLFARNLEIYEQIAKDNGILFEKGVNSLTVCGKLKAANYKIAGNISSQFISGLLFALPLLDLDSTLEITGDYESEPYVDLTLKSLSDFGVIIEKQNRTYKIKGNQHYVSKNLAVECDYSNAAFLDGFNLLNGEVEVTGLDDDSLQGDKIYKQMYNGLILGEKQFDLSNCPDLAPVMFALSAVYGGAHFSGTKRLKIKESDRAAAMQSELKKFGIDVDVEENSVTVHGGELKAPTEILCGHNDHRIVMALSLLCSVTGGSIDESESVAKSYPNFFETIKSLVIVVENES